MISTQSIGLKTATLDHRWPTKHFKLSSKRSKTRLTSVTWWNTVINRSQSCHCHNFKVQKRRTPSTLFVSQKLTPSSHGTSHWFVPRKNWPLPKLPRHVSPPNVDWQPLSLVVSLWSTRFKNWQKLWNDATRCQTWSIQNCHWHNMVVLKSYTRPSMTIVSIYLDTLSHYAIYMCWRILVNSWPPITKLDQWSKPSSTNVADRRPITIRSNE